MLRAKFEVGVANSSAALLGKAPASAARPESQNHL